LIEGSFEELLNHYVEVAKPEWLTGLTGSLMVLSKVSKEVDDYIKSLKWEHLILTRNIYHMSMTILSSQLSVASITIEFVAHDCFAKILNVVEEIKPRGTRKLKSWVFNINLISYQKSN
jgi:hypothetical protein